MFPFMPHDPPTEEELERHRASYEAAYREQHSFVDNLSEDEACLMSAFFQRAANEPAWASWMAGYLSSLSYFKFKTCRCNGEAHPLADHDKPDWLPPVPGPDRETSEDVSREITGGEGSAGYKAWLTQLYLDWNPDIHPNFVESLDGKSLVTLISAATRNPEPSDKNIQDVKTLLGRMNPVIEELDNGELRISWKCQCSLPYASLADRLLKPVSVDGCHGCNHKAKWG